MVTTMRVTIVLLVFGALAIALAGLRIEQTRALARIQHLHRRQDTLRETIAANEVRMARLSVPRRITDRVGELDLAVMPPEDKALEQAAELAP